MHHYDVITRRTVFRNTQRRGTCANVMLAGTDGNYHCGSSKVILKASSVSLDFEAEPAPFHMVQLSGRYKLYNYFFPYFNYSHYLYPLKLGTRATCN
jgi:hypothetical protein